MSTRCSGYYLKLARNQGIVVFLTRIFGSNHASREWGVFSAKGIVPFSATLVSLSSESHAINLCGSKNCTKDKKKKKPGRPANCCSANTYRMRIGDADYLKLPADGVLKLHHLTIFGQSVRTEEL